MTMGKRGGFMHLALSGSGVTVIANLYALGVACLECARIPQQILRTFTTPLVTFSPLARQVSMSASAEKCSSTTAGSSEIEMMMHGNLITVGERLRYSDCMPVLVVGDVTWMQIDLRARVVGGGRGKI